MNSNGRGRSGAVACVDCVVGGTKAVSGAMATLGRTGVATCTEMASFLGRLVAALTTIAWFVGAG